MKNKEIILNNHLLFTAGILYVSYFRLLVACAFSCWCYVLKFSSPLSVTSLTPWAFLPVSRTSETLILILCRLSSSALIRLICYCCSPTTLPVFSVHFIVMTPCHHETADDNHQRMFFFRYRFLKLQEVSDHQRLKQGQQHDLHRVVLFKNSRRSPSLRTCLFFVKP